MIVFSKPVVFRSYFYKEVKIDFQYFIFTTMESALLNNV